MQDQHLLDPLLTSLVAADLQINISTVHNCLIPPIPTQSEEQFAYSKCPPKRPPKWQPKTTQSPKETNTMSQCVTMISSYQHEEIFLFLKNIFIQFHILQVTYFNISSQYLNCQLNTLHHLNSPGVAFLLFCVNLLTT